MEINRFTYEQHILLIKLMSTIYLRGEPGRPVSDFIESG